jgi:hypothetical protein
MRRMAARQFTIEGQRYEALKLRAKALRISEDELLQRAVDVALAEPAALPVPDHQRALAEFLAAAREVSEGGAGAEPHRFSRDEIYEEREARWTRQG